jgi:hypothetical protein
MMKGNERMPVHLTIEATSVGDLIHQLDVLVDRLKSPQLVSVPEELGVGKQKPTPESPSSGAEVAPPKQLADEKPQGRRGRKAAAGGGNDNLDRDKTIKDLTAIYMSGEPAVREKITAWRDGQGVSRLRDLKDDSIAGAAKLLAELQAGP